MKMKFAQIPLNVSPELKADIRALAKRNRRSITEECRIALERHVVANKKRAQSGGSQ
jgi:hypothetical protein